MLLLCLHVSSHIHFVSCLLTHRILRWVDRDMYMRYLGGGVGHRSTWEETQASRRRAQRVPRKTSTPKKTRTKAVATNGDLPDQREGLMPITTEEELEDIDDDAPSRSALRIVDCRGERADSDDGREGSHDERADSDVSPKDSDNDREDLDDWRADVGGTREDSDDDREDLDGRRADLDGRREDSDIEHEGPDGGHEAAERDIDMGSEAEVSDSESGSDEDSDSGEELGGGSDEDGEGPVDTMYAPLGFAPL